MNATSPKPSRFIRLAKQLADAKFRHGYLSRHVRAYLATQIRALRGDISQQDFGKRLSKPQSVVSRLENQGTGVNVQTLIDIANKLDVGLLIRFVDYPTLWKWTRDPASAAIAPLPYRQEAIDAAAREDELRALLKERPDAKTPETASAKQDATNGTPGVKSGTRKTAEAELAA